MICRRPNLFKPKPICYEFKPSLLVEWRDGAARLEFKISYYILDSHTTTLWKCLRGRGIACFPAATVTSAVIERKRLAKVGMSTGSLHSRSWYFITIYIYICVSSCATCNDTFYHYYYYYYYTVAVAAVSLRPDQTVCRLSPTAGRRVYVWRRPRRDVRRGSGHRTRNVHWYQAGTTIVLPDCCGVRDPRNSPRDPADVIIGFYSAKHVLCARLYRRRRSLLLLLLLLCRSRPRHLPHDNDYNVDRGEESIIIRAHNIILYTRVLPAPTRLRYSRL